MTETQIGGEREKESRVARWYICIPQKMGIFWKALERKMSVLFIAIWYILQLCGKFYGHLVYLFVNWNIFSRFGMYVVPRKIWQP
jgi:hypothetical protein